MDHKDEKKIMSEMILHAAKAMVENKKDAIAFAKLIESEDFQDAYKMLTTPIKKRFSIEDFHKIASPEVVVTLKGYYEGPTIYKYLALQFSEYLVQNKFQDAYNLLSLKLKEEYSPEKLEEQYKRMIEYFHSDNISVYRDFVIAEGDAGYPNTIYVPIDGDGDQEAVYVDVDYEDESLCIKRIEWGRP